MKISVRKFKIRLFTGILCGVCVLFVTSCVRSVPWMSLGLEHRYDLPRMKAYRFTPGFTGQAYRWWMRLPDGRDSLLSTERNYTFIQKEEGIYRLRFDILDDQYPYTHDFEVAVHHEQVEYTPYITRVVEYCPAPGQFVNEMPLYEKGDTKETMRRKAEECLSGKNNVMVTLGGYGGYITFGFDHTVMNVEGKHDFLIEGNAFYELTTPEARGGSCEPGIVEVAFDRNLNGVADEQEWYELAGSEYYKPETIKNYEIRYQRPDPNRQPIPDESGNILDRNYLRWDDNQGGSGYIAKNRFHTQDYYPRWVSENELLFRGTKLPNNAVDESGYGAYWVLYAFDWGYADNHPNKESQLVSFDIGWAVNRQGERVVLPGVDFVRVYTGVNQDCGWIGETSSEIVHARDLHLSGK